MKLISLKLTNFRQHRATDILFADGITGILGRNGAGKSTLLEAIAWTLYGQEAIRRMDRGKVETIRSRGAGAGEHPEAILEFELGGQPCRVERNHKDARLEMEGRLLHTGAGNVTRAVSQLLKMDAQSFFTSFFTGQKDLAFLSDVSIRAREEYVGKLLGYERLSRARGLANDAKLRIGSEISGLRLGLGDIDEIKGRKADAAASLKEAARCQQQATAEADAAKAALSEIDPLKAASEESARRHASLKHDLDVLETQLDAVRANLLRSQEALAGIKKAGEELAGLRPLMEEYETLRKRNEELNDLRLDHARCQALEKQLTSATTEVAEIKKNIDRLEARLRSIGPAQEERLKTQDERKSAQQELDSIRADWQKCRSDLEAHLRADGERFKELQEHLLQMQEAGPDGICPTCERPLEDEFDRVTSQMSSEIAVLQKRAEDSRKELTHLSAEPDDVKNLSSRIAAFDEAIEGLRRAESDAAATQSSLASEQKRLADVQGEIIVLEREKATLRPGFNLAEFEKTRARGTEIKPKVERARALEANCSRGPEVEDELAGYASQMESLTAAFEGKQREVKELGFSEEDHHRLLKKWEQASGNFQQARDEAQRCAADVRGCETRLAEIERQEADYRERAHVLEEKQGQSRHLEFLTTAYDRLRRSLNADIRPRLAEEASSLIRDITDGRYSEVDLDEDYTPRLFDEGEWKPVISGGEEDILHLSLRLAVSRMIAERAGVDLGLLVLDEVFGSLDEDRREHVISLLQNLKGTFQQIFLITHIESIHDMVDRCIWVDYDPQTQCSRVREAREAEPAEVIPPAQPELALADMG